MVQHGLEGVDATPYLATIMPLEEYVACLFRLYLSGPSVIQVAEGYLGYEHSIRPAVKDRAILPSQQDEEWDPEAQRAFAIFPRHVHGSSDNVK